MSVLKRVQQILYVLAEYPMEAKIEMQYPEVHTKQLRNASRRDQPEENTNDALNGQISRDSACLDAFELLL